MNVEIKVIPHEAQRYKTCGDWFYQFEHYCPKCNTSRFTDEPVVNSFCGHCHDSEIHKEWIIIRVSALDDWRQEMLVAVHELSEVLMCRHGGVTQQSVDDFDKAYEAARPAEDTDSEPGDHPDAPYRSQHCMATGIERIMAAALGVCWEEYAQKIEALP